MEVTCGLCGGKTGPHCYSVRCPWDTCKSCKALGRVMAGQPVWRRVSA